MVMAGQTKGDEEISVVYCADSIPFHYTGSGGQAEGVIIDLWKIWSQKTGISIKFIPASWGDTLKMIREGEVDAHAGLFYNDERAGYLDYGVALQKTDTHIFYDKRLPSPENNKSFLPYRTGLLRGDAVETHLSSTFPNMQTFGFDSYKEIMAAVKQNELSVFAADTPTGLFYLKKSGLRSKFTYKPNMPLYQNQWYVAVQKGDTKLLEIINNGFESISAQEKLSIERQWTTGLKRKDTDELIIAVPSGYAPFSFVGPDGNQAGLLIDMWRLWSRETGVPIAFKVGSWADTLEAVKTGEADIHSGLFKNEERATWLSFSIPIFESETASYFLSDGEPITLKNAKAVSVGTMTGSYQEAYIRDNFPRVKRVTRTDNESLVLSLIKKEIDAFVHESPVVSADLSRLGLTGLVSCGETLFSNPMYAGVAKGRETLREKINKGFLDIPVENLAALEARWLPNAETQVYRENMDDIGLTLDEKKWVRTNPTIRVAATPNWPPFEFSDDGVYSGLHADMIRLAADKAGLGIEPVFGKWSDLVAGLKEGSLDLCPGLNATEERKKYLVFTDDYISETSQVIVAPANDPIHSIQELYGRTVSVERGYATETFLKKNFPDVRLLMVDNTVEAIKKLITGEADAYLGNQAAILYLIKKNAFSGLRITAFFKQAKRSEYRVGVTNEKTILRDILQKALAAVTTKEKSALQEKWFGRVLAKEKVGPELKLTEEEKIWLAKHSVIRVAMNADWAPVEFIDGKGNSHGISMDYLEKLGDMLGLRFDIVKNLTWQEKQAAMGKGDLDLLSSMSQAGNGEGHYHFTPPYLSIPINIFATDDVTYIRDLTSLEDTRVAVVEGQGIQEWLQNQYPEIDIVPADSIPAALKMLANGEAYAFVGDIVTTSYYISKLRLHHIRIVGETPYKNNQSMAVRRDWPIFANILQKGLKAIPQNEREAIFNRWVSVQYEHGFDYSLLWKALVPACFIILLFVYWNRKLGKEIQSRKETEKKLSFTQYAMDHAFHSVFWVDPETGKFIYINKAACKSLGYTREEMLDMAVPQIDVDFPAEKLEPFIETLREHDFIPTKGQHRKKNGCRIEVELICYLTDYIEGEIIVVFALDITERVTAQHERDEAFRIIRSSIEYASRIQRSILPPAEQMETMVKDYFVLWEPRDLVGGDIYWCMNWGQGVLIILADCTGHGVPGAFMTLISSGALARGILDVPKGDPAALIQRMHQLIQIVLGQDSKVGHSDDGLEMGVCYIHPGRDRITFSGAGFPLFKLKGEDIDIIKGEKRGIGYRQIAFDSTWTNQEILVGAGDRFYMSSDGIFDQIGGPKRRGFGKKRFRKLLASVQNLTMANQGERIYREVETYQGKEKRRDDISAIGFRL